MMVCDSNTMQCRNGHFICEGCHEKNKRNNFKKCSICKDTNPFIRVKGVDRIVSYIKVSILLFVRFFFFFLLLISFFWFWVTKVSCTAGCGKLVENGSLEKHLQEQCTKNLIQCAECKMQVPAAQMKRHREEKCSKELVECSLCHQNTYHLRAHHEHFCPERMVKCPNCRLEYKAKDKQNHNAKICLNRYRPCPQGCHTRVPLSEIPDHLESETFRKQHNAFLARENFLLSTCLGKVPTGLGRVNVEGEYIPGAVPRSFMIYLQQALAFSPLTVFENHGAAEIRLALNTPTSDPQVAFRLGRLFEYGLPGCLPQNRERAIQLYTLSQDVRAKVALALMLYDVPGEEARVVELLSGAVSQHPQAATMLGKMYEGGKGGLPQDSRRAINLYKQAGTLESKVLLARLLLQEERTESVGVRLLHSAAKEGYGFAQLVYGRVQYRKNLYSQAFRWWKKAAEQGYVQAQFDLALFLQSGRGCKQDLEKAIYWMEKSAAKDFPLALYHLGWWYEEGIAVKADKAKALHYYFRAAAEGSVSAYHQLGVAYLKGEVVPAVPHEALRYFQLGAEGNDLESTFDLAHMYEHGIGTPQNEQKAFELYMKAAKVGDEVAQYCVGKMYYDGRGTEENKLEAAVMYMSAANNGDKNHAHKALQGMYDRKEVVEKNVRSLFEKRKAILSS